MKQLCKPLLNWRTHILCIPSAVAFILIVSDSRQTSHLIIAKAAGIAIAYATGLLARHWARKGKINELTSLTKEE